MFARFLRVTFAVIALGLLSGAVYRWYGQRELHRWLREQAAELGCSLEYGAAEVGWPGHFSVKDALLYDCDRATWSARVTRATATVKPRSLLWGRVAPTNVALEVREVEWAGLSLRGPLHVRIESVQNGLDARIESEKLMLKQNERELADGSGVTLIITIPARRSAPRNVARFTLRSLSLPSWGLVAQEPVTGMLELGYDVGERRLEVADGNVRATSWRFGEQSLTGELSVRSASCSPTGCSGHGRAQLNGDDAVALIEQLRAPEALVFALSGLKGATFELHSRVAYGEQTWTFDDLELRAKEARIWGSASLRGGHRNGALRANYRGFSLGVQFSHDQSSVIFDPPSDWPPVTH
ncbi:MAG: hypothetical protein K0R38_596 [Polyangiaceae bacterium]|nr:hypothetical protein [Polyangiaceae bacterium]